MTARIRRLCVYLCLLFLSTSASAALPRVTLRPFPADATGVFTIHVTIHGEPYREHALESSDDGIVWRRIGGFVWNENGSLLFVLHERTATPMRFFRAVKGKAVTIS